MTEAATVDVDNSFDNMVWLVSVVVARRWLWAPSWWVWVGRTGGWWDCLVSVLGVVTVKIVGNYY